MELYVGQRYFRGQSGRDGVKGLVWRRAYLLVKAHSVQRVLGTDPVWSLLQEGKRETRKQEWINESWKAKEGRLSLFIKLLQRRLRQ